MKLQASRPTALLKRTLTQVFSCEYCKFLKNTYFEDNLQTAASIDSFTFHLQCFDFMPKTVCIMYVILIIMLSAKIKLKSVYSGNCKYRFTKIQHEKEFRSQSTKTYSVSCSVFIGTCTKQKAPQKAPLKPTLNEQNNFDIPTLYRNGAVWLSSSILYSGLTHFTVSALKFFLK